jgi:3-hydroxyisobutyrate dehydrogenase-like beta-hydroxyacid dehydrogenase
MVFGPAQITEVLRGERGLLAGGVAGKAWVDMTTSSPFLMRELAAEVIDAGGDAVDAPVTGSVDSAICGDMILLIFAGHEDPSFRIALCLKDLGLIEGLIDAVGTRSEITAATHARFREAGERYGDGAGEMTVCKVIEDDAGIDLRVAGDWAKPWEVRHPSER